MSKITTFIVAICLIQTIFSACADGTYTNTPGAGSTTVINCTSCLPGCLKCTDSVSCTKWDTSIFKGVDSTPAAICSNSITATTGYSKSDDACARCMTGCATCFVDYDYCTDCQAGYDWDKSGNKCVRATLGLAAVVLALSVITLIFGVIICLLGCKL